jgi:hypothetical protein
MRFPRLGLSSIVVNRRHSRRADLGSDRARSTRSLTAVGSPTRKEGTLGIPPTPRG